MHQIEEYLRRRALPVLAIAFLLAALPACAQSNSVQAEDGSGGDEVVAKVAGEEITMDELNEAAEPQLQQVQQQLEQCQRQAKQGRYDALSGVLQNMVREQLLEAEAAAAGQTAAEYRQAELDSRIQPVTDEDVNQFFEQNRARIGNRTLEQVGPQIRQYLERQNRQQAEDAFYGELESKHDVAVMLDPPRVDVAATGLARGPEDAPVTIVEFSDFECPFCSRVIPTLEQVKENYGDKVRLVFRHFPLNIHPNAQKAAEASMCAADQGKFWEMHDAMFANQRQLGVDNLKTMAADLELDTEQFGQCLDSGTYADEVQADLQAGVEAGVSGTPAMFINGRMVSGAVPYEQVAEVIDEELKRHETKAGTSGSAE